jgi:hypothetical protein
MRRALGMLVEVSLSLVLREVSQKRGEGVKR